MGCPIKDLGQMCPTCCVPLAMTSDIGVRQEQIVLHSWMVFVQNSACAAAVCLVVVCILASVVYYQLVRHRVRGLPGWTMQRPFFHWLRLVFEAALFGWFSLLLFASLPEWVGATRMLFALQLHRVVASMLGRT